MSFGRSLSTFEGRRFLWLDAGRGIAAIGVMFYHYGDFLNAPSLFRPSYLAVDLFFILSGFVLSHAYGQKLADGMPASRYIVVRIVRLYPVYLIATLVGAAYFSSKIAMGMDDAPSGRGIFTALIQNLLFLPQTIQICGLPSIFPFSPASWSLAAEMFVSVLFGLGLWKLKDRELIGVLALTGAAFAFLSWRAGSLDLGFNAPTFNPGLLRATSEFCLGMLLYRLAGQLKPVKTWVTVGILLLICCVFLFAQPSWTVGIVSILILFPAFIIFQPAAEPSGMLAVASEFLGRVSYPLYLLHTPLLLWSLGVFKALGFDPDAFSPSFALWTACLSIISSWLVVKLYDEPSRAALTGWFRSRRNPENRQIQASTDR